MNPLFHSSNSPTKTTKPTKAVNEASTHVRLTHNTFDNSYFNFKTQRYGKYEPFWWKVCVPGDNQPYSNSHNVRSLPFASPIESPMKLNKDYFQVPMYAIQPNAWDYIYKNPTQGDDVPVDAQNLFPLFLADDSSRSIFSLFLDSFSRLNGLNDDGIEPDTLDLLVFIMYENFLSSGSLLFQLGYKLNPIFFDGESYYSYDEMFDLLSQLDFLATFRLDDPDSPTGYRDVSFVTSSSFDSDAIAVDHFTFFSLLRSHIGSLVGFDSSLSSSNSPFDNFTVDFGNILVHSSGDSVTGIDSIRMDVINAYQLSCAQYYVNPRVDFIYNAQLYRDNFIQLVREFRSAYSPNSVPLPISSFDYNGIPVLHDYLSLAYYRYILNGLCYAPDSTTTLARYCFKLASVLYYLFGFQDQLRFGDYLADSRPQMLGYGEPGSDVVQVMDGNVSVIDMSQKLVLQRFRGAVAHLDNSAEDYLETMFHETLPPDYHFPKFIVHSEFAINGEEVSNTTSDDQGMIVTNLKSGDDTSEFNIEISVPSILIGISYISIPAVYCQTKERHYMHEDRFDMFQPMLQYLGDQAILNREVSDTIENPGDSYAYASRNAEYKQRLSQCSGAFLTTLRSWIFTVDLPLFGKESYFPRLVNHQSPIAIRTYDFQFNRFLRRQTGISLGTGFHFIMKYNNKNVDNRPMDVNPLPLYPSNSL